jgi:hypothetical protein
MNAQDVHTPKPPLDYERRNAFWKWLLLREISSPTLISRVLLVHEVSFAQNGLVNTRNQHMWANENPHSFQQTQLQQQFAACLGRNSWRFFPRPSWATASSTWGLLLTVSNWTIAATFGRHTTANAARTVGICMMGLLPIILAVQCGI